MSKLPEDIWQSLMESAPNIILVIDKEGTILYINQAVPGLNPDEVIGQNQYNFVEPEHRDIVHNTIDHVLTTGKAAS